MDKKKIIADITKLYAVLEEIHEEKKRLSERKKYKYDFSAEENAQLKLLNHLEHIYYTGMED